MSNPWHFTMRKPRPREVNDLAKATERVSTTADFQECWLYLWSVSQFRSHGDFCMPVSVTTPGERISHDMGFSWFEMGDLGARRRALFDTAASPLCSTLTPWRQNCQHLHQSRSLGRYEINTAWQLCSRVMTCSPSCHFQLDFSLSSLHVI